MQNVTKQSNYIRNASNNLTEGGERDMGADLRMSGVYKTKGKRNGI